MSTYYLMAQLPSLDGLGENAPPPIGEERFLQLCGSFLGKKARLRLEKLRLMPPREYEKTGSALIDAWNQGERRLRIALAAARAERMKKSFDGSTDGFPLGLLKAAREAAAIENPMEAELFLNRFRMDFLESIRPRDMFAEDSVYYYGLKLKLMLRISRFDLKSGREAYRNIYGSVLGGDRMEVLS